MAITQRALVTILVEAQASADGAETGGILAGHHGDDTLIVTCAGGPGPKAIRRPDLFVRDLAYADALLERAYDEDGALWIGDWHTHTIVSGRPSSTDRASYQRLLGDEDHAFEVFLALIVTSSAGTFADAEINTWLARGRRVMPGEILLP